MFSRPSIVGSPHTIDPAPALAGHKRDSSTVTVDGEVPNGPNQKVRRPLMEYQNSPALHEIPIMASTDQQNATCSNLNRGYNVATSNKFSTLADCDADTPAGIQKKANKNGKEKIPLVTITETNIPTVQGMALKAGVSMFNVKRTSTGVNVFMYTTQDHTKLVSYLKQQKANFFTYVRDEDRTTKVVLAGLPDLNIEVVAEALKEVEVVPKDIRKMTLKKKRHEDHALYLLYFNKGSVQLNALRRIKSVYRCIVEWDFYSTKTKGPVQCRNCQMFGHGSTQCFRQPRCVKCGNVHKTVDCPLTISREDKSIQLPKEKLSCVNCGQQHTANFHQCVKRQEFINARDHQLRKSRLQRSRREEFQFRQEDFPQSGTLGELPQRSHNHRTPLYSNVLSHREAPANRLQFKQHQTHRYHHDTPSNHDLFSPEEIVDIVTDVFSRLSTCTTKQQQLKVIFEITAHYCFPCNG